MVATAGCLDMPVGVEQTWPPPDVTMEIASITASDLDADRAFDLTVANLGAADAGGGLYVLRGGVDLLAGETPVVSFERLIRLDLEAPVKVVSFALVPGSTRDLLLLHPTADGITLTAVDGDTLDIVVTAPLGITDIEPTTALSLAVVPLGGNDFRAIAIVGSTIVQINVLDLLDSDDPVFTEIPAPAPALAWDAPRIVFGYLEPMRHLVIVTDTAVWRSPLEPTASSWQAVRTGEVWTAQALGQLNGDDVLEVIGVSSTREICAIDPTLGPSVEQPACVDVGLAGDGFESFRPDVVLHDSVALNAQPDLVLLEAGETIARVTVVPSIDATATEVTGGLALPLAPRPVPAAAIAGGDFDGRVPREMMLVSRDGSVACLVATGASLANCLP